MNLITHLKIPMNKTYLTNAGGFLSGKNFGFTLEICYKNDYHPDDERTILQWGSENDLDKETGLPNRGILIRDHDLYIGKQKIMTLTDEEFAVIKTHPAMGAQLLSGITWLKDIIPWVRGHHERYDGKGYPDGLAGEDIPHQARIIAVADAFDAMTSDRRYRSSLSLDKALAELEKVRGSQLDPHFVDVFKKLVTETDMWQRAATIINLGFAGEENHGK